MIADIVKAQRKKHGQTQQEVAEVFHVTRQTVSNWENEKSYPDIHSLLLLVSIFLIGTLFVTFFCLGIFLLSMMGILHF